MSNGVVSRPLTALGGVVLLVAIASGAVASTVMAQEATASCQGWERRHQG